MHAFRFRLRSETAGSKQLTVNQTRFKPSLILLAATQRTGVRQQAVALVSSHAIDAGALVEAGVGGALVDVSLAVRPCVGGIREARVKHKLGAHTQNKRKSNGGKVDAGRWRFTGEAGPASAVVSAGHIPAGPSVHARVGFTLVVVDVTVASAPARVACAFVAKAQQKFALTTVFHGGHHLRFSANLDTWSTHLLMRS